MSFNRFISMRFILKCLQTDKYVIGYISVYFYTFENRIPQTLNSFRYKEYKTNNIE